MRQVGRLPGVGDYRLRLWVGSSCWIVFFVFCCFFFVGDESNGEITCLTGGYYDGTLSEAALQRRLREQLVIYFELMDNIYDWYPMQPINGNEIKINVTPDVNGIIDSRPSQERQGIRAGPFIGAATAMLAVLLLLVLFVRRRNRYDQDIVSHLKLDDEDDTFFNGSEASGLQNEYNTRDIHIVGEGDSVISHWTGYTGRSKPNQSYNRDGIMRGRSSDVHQCSSATCELCDKNRMGGVNFIKTGTPSIPERTPSLPSDASREYIADDTVQL